MTPPDRRVSKTPVAPCQTKPGAPATAFSFTRQVVRRSSDSIHVHCWTRYRAKQIPGFPVRRNSANVRVRIEKSGLRQKPELQIAEYQTLRAVCYGNKPNLLETDGPREISCNFFPFDTGLIGQWCGRRTRAPARGVSGTTRS